MRGLRVPLKVVKQYRTDAYGVNPEPLYYLDFTPLSD